jgi:hypothetical protein
MYSIKLLDIRSIDEYRDTIYDGGIDSCLINEHDNWNNYYVGHRQTMGRQIVGTIVGYIHIMRVDLRG